MKQIKMFGGLLVITLFLSSCALIVRKLMGVKQPQIETNKSIKKFMEKNGINSVNCFHIDSIASYHFWKERGDDRMTNMEIYNGDGKLLKKLGSKECSGAFAKSLVSIDLPSMKPILLTTKNLDDVLKIFVNTENKHISATSFKSDEYVIAIYWMKCFGSTIFKQNVVEWTKQLTINPGNSKIKILYLNTDMHESWGIKTKDDDRRIVFDF